MRLVVTEYVSLDGIFEEPGQWSFEWWNEEAAKFKHEELFASDAQLLGRKTYEGFAAAWPTMPGTGDFGERMNGMPKYVVSSTLTKADWTNTTVLSGDAVEEATKLKAQPGRDLIVAGSGELVRALTKAGLVDEYRFMLYPVVLGSGKRLFPDGSDKTALKLVDTRPFSSGIVVMTYEPAAGAA